ncbi:MAG: acyl-CoA dehydrogenase family protein [Polyangiales bacterium]
MREAIDETVEARGPGLSTDDLRFLFDDAHAALADTSRSVVKSILAREKQGGSEHAIARDTIAILGRAGLTELFSDPAKVDLRGICVAREALAWASGSADSLFAVQGLGTYPIAAWGNEAQRAAYLPKLRAGEAVGAFGLTEPEAGTDVASLKTVAVRDGNRWRITGRKTFISNAPVADHVVLFANADPPKGRKGITAFLVKKGLPGLRVHEDLPLVADHSIGSLELNECIVEDEDRLGNVGDGFRIAMATLDTFRVTVGAAAVGMARRALEEATRRTTVRHQFGKPIADQQQVQAYLADSLAELDASRLLVLRAAKLRDDGAPSITQEAAIAKMFATEAAQRIIDRCLQLHGGMGVVRGVAVERLYREIRALRIYEGTTEIQRVVIASRMLEREKGR